MKASIALLKALGTALLWLAPAGVSANHVVNSASVDGGASTTVTPGATVSVSATVAWSPNPVGWKSTAWTVATAPPGLTSSPPYACANHANASSSPATLTFSITAPAAPGTYNLYLFGSNNDACGTHGTPVRFTLSSAIVVQPAAVCGNGIVEPPEVCDGGACCTSSCTFEPAATVCNPGSGDLCDPDEMCTGASATCPTDAIAAPGTVCNPGSGDACDPDELCTGVADEACPADVFEPATTVCNPGSGDACDPDELCTGVADEACPADVFEPATTVCNPGSGDLCDPDELCTGVADEACPADVFEPATTVCNLGSGDLCDPDELCTGVADEACPADVFEPATTVCNPGSGDLCDPDETCSGIADEACPADTVTPAGETCNPGSGDLCDPDEVCTGIADEACPDDGVEPPTTVCNPSSTGDETCDPSEFCTGAADEACPDDYIAPEGFACGDPATTQCSLPDTCDGAGTCEFRNRPCGSATSSALCEFDMEPTKGTCAGGSEDGSACFVSSPCVQGGGICDTDLNVCNGGTADTLYCEAPEPEACELGGGTCEQSSQFRLLFSPDVQNWTAYRLNASNPGQTYYNLIYDASGAGTEDLTLTVTVPYPYVTVGGMPLHIYDAETVGSDGMGCLAPEEAIRSEPMFITLDDWIFGASGAGDYNLNCDLVLDPNGSGYCSFDVVVLNEEIPVSGLLYVNVHLDYGLKGKWVDANPVGPDGVGIIEDRYDRHADISPWGSSDALVNTDTDDGPLALEDCSAYWFEHTDDVTAGFCFGGADDGAECNVDACAGGGGVCNVDTCEGGDLDGEACTPTACIAGGGDCAPTPLFDDKLENLNIFKKISGAFGRAFCADDDSSLGTGISLQRVSDDAIVAGTDIDDEGFFGINYRHRGKPTQYRLVWTDGVNTHATAAFGLKSNGFVEVELAAEDGCDELDDPAPNDWLPIDPICGPGKCK